MVVEDGEKIGHLSFTDWVEAMSNRKMMGCLSEKVQLLS